MVDLDHPCKGTCSGWKQGYERGAADAHNQKWGCRDEIQRLRAALSKLTLGWLYWPSNNQPDLRVMKYESRTLDEIEAMAREALASGEESK